MPTFITPPELSGTAELTTGQGLVVIQSGLWQRDPASLPPGVSWAVSLTYPQPQESGLLHLRAQGWSIPGGNELTPYTDTSTGITYSAEQARITVRGRWQVDRRPNSDSYNSFGVLYSGRTETDLGSRDMDPWLLGYTSPLATYIIQGSAVEGGAQDTFTPRMFECRITETVRSDNSNRQYQSNSLAQPRWQYQYLRQWQTD